MPATLIIPGYKGSEAGHWQRQWLHDDPSALFVEQDDWHYPVLSDWMHALEAKLAENPGQFWSHIVLAAHWSHIWLAARRRLMWRAPFWLHRPTPKQWLVRMIGSRALLRSAP